MRPSFSKLKQPFIVAVAAEPEPEANIAVIKTATFEGADAFDLHLMALDRQYHNKGDLRKIISSTSKPVMTLFYRWNMKGMVNIPDEERVRTQLDALDVGSAGFDITADIFDPTPGPDSWTPEARAYSMDRNAAPREVSYRPEAVKKQMKLIEQAHSMGGEVLLSAHTRVVLNTEKSIAIAKELESRGADMIKIVSVCLNQEDLLEAFRTIVELKKTLKVPFQFQCHGEHGKLTRLVGPMLGSMLVFCNQYYRAGGFHHQPLVRGMKSILQWADWEVTKTPEEEMFI
ncbi:MAG: type I 3-dehydroquinate dehydratase [Bacillota bacterium]